VKPYLPRGEALGKLLAQITPASADRLYITYGGNARLLPNVDPVTRAVLRGFLSTSNLKDINNVNVRSVAQSIGITVEEKKSDEPVTFNEWVHVQVFSNGKKLISAGGTFFGSPNNPRIVRLYSQSVELPATGTLWVYDRLVRQWANLGPSTISPSEDWDYMQPSWDPWFADGKHLVFFSGSDLIISSPDGRIRRVLSKTNQTAGLAAPSENGESVAYVTFQNRPMQARSDLKFWKNTGVWVISTTGTTPPRSVTGMDLDTTTGLRWIGNDVLVFDRIGENLMAMHARIWKVTIH